MKLIFSLYFVLVLMGCSAASKVGSATDSSLCEMHGVYWLQQNKVGLELTTQEIQKRQLSDDEYCKSVVKSVVENHSYSYKKSHCEKLATFHSKGAYTQFKNTLEALNTLQMADNECLTMAEFYLKRLQNSKAKKEAIAQAFQSAAQNPKPIEVAPLGSYFNPIHLKVEHK